MGQFHENIELVIGVQFSYLVECWCQCGGSLGKRWSWFWGKKGVVSGKCQDGCGCGFHWEKWGSLGRDLGS